MLDPSSNPAAHRLAHLERDGHRWIFRCATGAEKQLVRCFASMAADDRYALTWPDAAALADQLGRQMREQLLRLEP